jgi:hypothetical protein
MRPTSLNTSIKYVRSKALFFIPFGELEFANHCSVLEIFIRDVFQGIFMPHPCAPNFKLQFYLWKRWIKQSFVILDRDKSSGIVDQITWRILLLMMLCVTLF